MSLDIDKLTIFKDLYIKFYHEDCEDFIEKYEDVDNESAFHLLYTFWAKINLKHIHINDLYNIKILHQYLNGKVTNKHYIKYIRKISEYRCQYMLYHIIKNSIKPDFTDAVNCVNEYLETSIIKSDTIINTLKTIKNLIEELQQDPTNKLIGYKIIDNTFYIATNCKKSRSYNEKNYNKFYGIYEIIFYFGFIPIIENYQDIVTINNDNKIVMRTKKSKLYMIEIIPQLINILVKNVILVNQRVEEKSLKFILENEFDKYNIFKKYNI